MIKATMRTIIVNFGWYRPHTHPVFFFSKGSYFYDRPKSLLLVIEPVLLIHFLIFVADFGVKLGNSDGIGQVKKTVHTLVLLLRLSSTPMTTSRLPPSSSFNPAGKLELN
jgi:hypothetical protein